MGRFDEIYRRSLEELKAFWPPRSTGSSPGSACSTIPRRRSSSGLPVGSSTPASTPLTAHVERGRAAGATARRQPHPEGGAPSPRAAWHLGPAAADAPDRSAGSALPLASERRGYGIEPTAFSRRLRDTAEQAVRQELGDGVVDAELAHGATLTLAVALRLGPTSSRRTARSGQWHPDRARIRVSFRRSVRSCRECAWSGSGGARTGTEGGDSERPRPPRFGHTIPSRACP